MTWERRRNRKWCFMEPCFGLPWLAHTGTKYDNHQQPRYAMGDWIFRLRTSSMTVSRLVEPSYSKSNIWTFWFPQTHRNQLLIILRMLQERRNDSQTLRAVSLHAGGYQSFKCSWVGKKTWDIICYGMLLALFNLPLTHVKSSLLWLLCCSQLKTHENVKFVPRWSKTDSVSDHCDHSISSITHPILGIYLLMG